MVKFHWSALCDIGMKYFIGYRHEGNTFLSSLCLKLSQMNAYTKWFDRNNKYINLRKIFWDME